MAIITISRGSYSKGREIAEKLAEEMDYACVSRDVLLEASEHYNIPEIRLVRALHDAPAVLDRFTNGKKEYIAYIQSAFLERVRNDNVVYHGLAGHFFLRGIGHGLKVRIIADMEDRVRLEMEREAISAQQARQILEKDDRERRNWALALYGIDTADSTLYDLVVHIRKISVDDAVDLISYTARLPHFQTTADSQTAMENAVLAARVKSTIVNDYANAEVSAQDGVVVVHTEGPLEQEARIAEQIRTQVEGGEGIREVRVHVRPTSFV